MRGQANLPALVVALLVVTTTAGLALTLADGAFAGAQRDATERRAAVALAERVVAPDSPLTTRANVLNATAVDGLTARRFASAFPVAAPHDVRLRLGDRTLLARGDPAGGTAVRRIVIVERRQTVTVRPPLRRDRTTLPRRTPRVRLHLAPANATVRTVRANDRVVLRDPDGLRGTYTVRVSRFETTTLAFAADADLSRGDVRVTYFPARTTKATLEVIVDA